MAWQLFRRGSLILSRDIQYLLRSTWYGDSKHLWNVDQYVADSRGALASLGPTLPNKWSTYLVVTAGPSVPVWQDQAAALPHEVSLRLPGMSRVKCSWWKQLYLFTRADRCMGGGDLSVTSHWPRYSGTTRTLRSMWVHFVHCAYLKSGDFSSSLHRFS
jgi:hypothetical protein